MSALQLVLIQIVTFALFIWVLKFIFYNDLSKAKKRLSVLNLQNIERENELAIKVEAAEKESLQLKEYAMQEAQKVRDDAKKEVEKIIRRTKEVAEKEKEEAISRANDRLEKVEADLLIKSEKKSISIGCEIVEGLLTDTAREMIHNQFLIEFIDEIEGIEKEKIDIHTSKGNVFSPFPLKEGQKKRLEEALSSKSGKIISLEEERDESLIIGLKISLDGLVLDGTLRNKLEKIKRR